MNAMDLAKQVLASKLGADQGVVGNVLGGLLSSQGGGAPGLDGGLTGLMGAMQNNGMADVAESWMGDGANAAVSAGQLKDMLGGESVTAAAKELGTSEDGLLGMLQQTLPQIIDKSSAGGSMLDKVGGLGGIAGMAKKFM